MKVFAIIFLSLFSFKSCLQDGTTINVVMDDAAGLKSGSKVKCKGLDVGKVNDIKIVGDKVIATIKLYEDFQPTKGSSAVVNLENIFNGRNLTILPSSSTEFLSNGDTIYAKSNNGLELINSFIKGANLDSIVGDLDVSLDSLSDGLMTDSAKFRKLFESAGKMINFNK